MSYQTNYLEHKDAYAYGYWDGKAGLPRCVLAWSLPEAYEDGYVDGKADRAKEFDAEGGQL
jgi:hypothetical protein